MNENREKLLQALYSISQELLNVQNYTEEMEQAVSQMRPELKAVTCTTIRAKLKQAAASLIITTPAACAIEGLLYIRIDEALVLAALTALVYWFFKPERYRDKGFGLFSIVLAGIGALFLKLTAETVHSSLTKGWLAENYPALAAAFVIFWAVVFGVIAVVVYRLLSKRRDRRNEEIIEENQEIRARNRSLHEQYVRAEKLRAQHSDRLGRLCGSWFPMKYCYSYAVRHFIQFMENYQADTIKELVNLFETSEYRRRVEEAQRQTQRELEFMTLNNMIENQLLRDDINRGADRVADAVNRNTDAIYRTRRR